MFQILMVGHAANLFMAGFFVLSAVLQFNDPDPFIWISIYGLAALSCIFYSLGRLRPYVPVFLSIGALAWSLAIFPGVNRGFPFWQIEEGRESMGLLLVSCWMGILAWKKYPARL